jgi:hypothetical protein
MLLTLAVTRRLTLAVARGPNDVAQNREWRLVTGCDEKGGCAKICVTCGNTS